MHRVSAAGRELALAPAVASTRLAKLEHTLGADLLRRSTRNAALDDSSLRCRKLANVQRVLCASSGYLDSRGTPLGIDDLDQHQLIGFRDASPKALIGRAGKLGQGGYFDPKRTGCRLTVDNSLSLKIATMAGAGISMNSLWSVHREIAQGTLVRVSPDFEVDDQSALWLRYPQANVLTLKVRVFMDFLLDRIGKHPVWAGPQD